MKAPSTGAATPSCSKLAENLKKVDSFLSKYPNLFQYEMLKSVEKKTGYSKVYFFGLFVCLLGGVLYFLGGSKLISDLVSFIYPAYMSFKAVDSADPTDDTQWLTYWVVFAFVSIIESCAAYLIEYIPLYFFLKLGFFIWCYHPKFLGAGLIYTQVIKPFLMPYVKAFGTPIKEIEEKKTE